MKRGRALAETGEFAFLRRLLPQLRQRADVKIGPGDDCAVVRSPNTSLLLTTDALVEGVHFESDWLTPAEIGAKAMLVNLSDIAAMGGNARFAMLSIGAPPRFARAQLARLHLGAERVARRAGVSIVGGNLSGADRLFVSVALVGEAKHPVLRSGAAGGDQLFVTGTLGDAAAAVRLLRLSNTRKRDNTVGKLLRRFAAPTPRTDVGRKLAEADVVSAMIDVSDGLVQDLGHVCEASGVGAVVFEECVPRSPAYERVIGADASLALCGGEDYELLFAVPRRALPRFERLRRRLSVSISPIGEIVAGPRGVRVRREDGRVRRITAGGFEHFKRA